MYSKLSLLFILFISLACSDKASMKGLADSNSTSNWSIEGLGEVTANGVSTLQVKITLKDDRGKPLVGIVPAFAASGDNNQYGECSPTNAEGVSICSLASTKAEPKELIITHPSKKPGEKEVEFKNGPPHAIVFKTGPQSGIIPSIGIPEVAIVDKFGNPIKEGLGSDATISLALSSGAGSLNGNLTAQANEGTATFDDLSIEVVGTKVITATSVINGQTFNVSSQSFNMLSPGAGKLVFTTAPNNTANVGSLLSSQPVVEIQDIYGNLVSNNSSINLELHSNSNCTSPVATTPNGTASISGTTTINSSNGVASFSGLAINKSGNALYLKASSGSLVPACTSALNISSGTFSLAESLFTVSSTTVASGSSISAVLSARDNFGNQNPSGVTTIAYSAASGSFSATSGSSGEYTSFFTADTLGAVTLSALINGSTVTTTRNITVVTGAPTKLAFTTEPSATSTAGNALAIQPVVVIQDVNNNTVTASTDTISLALYSDSSCSTAVSTTANGSSSIAGTTAMAAVNGQASFSGVSINVAASALYLRASSGSLTTDCSSAINVSPNSFSLAESSLEVSGTSVTAGSTLTVTMTAKDAFGNSNPSGVTTATFSAATGSFSSVSSSAGVHTVTFTADTAGSVSITGSLNGSAISDSESVTVNVGSADRLSFSTEPSSTGVAGSVLSTQPVVRILDAGNNLVTSESSAVVIGLYSDSSCSTAVTTTVSGAASLGGTTSVNASSGVSTFTNIVVNHSGSTLYLRASSGSLTTDCSSVINVSPGAFSSTVSTLTVSGTTMTAGSSITATLTARDAYGNSNPSGISSGNFSASSGSFSSVTGSAGVYTGNFSSTTPATVTISGLINGSAISTTRSVTVTYGAANKVAFSTEPASSGTAGATLSTQPVVQILDSYNNIISNDTSTVTLALYSDSSCSTAVATTPSGAASVGGTSSLAAVGGVATFTNIAINSAASILYLRASSGALITDCSSVMNISPGAFSLSQSTLGVSSSSVASGATLTTTLVAKDAYGNGNPSGVTTVTFSSSAAGAGTFGSTNNAGSGIFTAVFTADQTGVTTLSGLINSSAITQTQAVTVGAGAAAKVAFRTEPSTTGTAGTALATQPVVEILDANDNVVTTATSTVSLAIYSDSTCSTAVATTPGGSASIGGTASISASSGVASFSGISVNRSSSALYIRASVSGISTDCSNAINVSPGSFSTSGSTLAVSSSTVTSGSSITATLTALDAFGNANPTGVTAVTFSSTSIGGTGSFGSTTNAGSGVYTASFTADRSGSTTLSGLINGSSINQTQTVTVNAGAATKVAFRTEPSTTGIAGSSLGTQPIVDILDSNNNIVTSSSSTVSLALYSEGTCTTAASTTPSGAASLGGTTSISASSGVATFSGIGVNRAASTLYLRASVSGLTADCSSAMNISPGAFSTSQSTLAVSSSTVASGSAIGITLTAKDAYGNGSPSGVIGVTFGSTTVGGTGSFGSTTDAGSGVYTANFTGNVAGSVTLSGLINGSVISQTQAVTVTHGTATNLAYTTQPGGAVALQNLSAQPVIEIRDANGNRVTSGADSTRTVSLSLFSGTGVLNGTASVAAVGGIATFSGLSVSKSGTKVLRASATVNSVGVTRDSNSFSITGTTPVANNMSPPDVTVGVESIITLSYTNADGDPATSCSASSPWKVTITQACACSAGTCTVGVTGSSAGAGSINFNVTANSQTSLTRAANFTVVSGDTAPVANAISQLGISGGMEFTFTLPYTDAEGDSATSCTVTSLTRVSTSTACSCSGGVCTVGLTGTSSGVGGAGSFNFTVTANGLVSNSRAVSFYVCPTGYAAVGANSTFGVSSMFCVMQFEAKDVGGVATSQPALTPWVSIAIADAQTECNALNALNSVTGKYDLISNPEWMTIAREVEYKTENWTGGVVGSGAIKTGHHRNDPTSPLAVSNINDPLDGVGPTTSPSGGTAQNERILFLSSNNKIWDFSGNVHEWTDFKLDAGLQNITPAKKAWESANGGQTIQVSQWDTVDRLIGENPDDEMLPITFMPGRSPFSGGAGYGAYRGGTGTGGGHMLRGGAYTALTSGIYNMDLRYNSARVDSGFRCVYRP